MDSTAKRVRVVWHYQAVSERRTFTITYRFRGLAVAYDDVVDVDLNVWGKNWPVGVARLTAEILLPRETPLDRAYRVYGHPAWVHGTVERTPNEARLEASVIPPKQFVEFRVTFPRRLLSSAAGTRLVGGPGLQKIIDGEEQGRAATERDRKQIDDAVHHIGRTILYLLLLGVGPALLLIALTWLVYGRERPAAYDREYEQEPPSDAEPALVPPLLRQETTPGSYEFTATLFDLIRRGRYHATPVTTQKKVWGGLRHEDIADLEVSHGDETLELAPFERPVEEIVNVTLADGPERLSKFRDRIEEDRQGNSKRFASFKEKVERRSRGRGGISDAARVCSSPASSSSPSPRSSRSGSESTGFGRKRRAGATSP